MGVPRCKKKKRNPEDRLVKRAEKILQADMDAHYNETAMDMSKTVGSMYHLALERTFGFTLEDDIRLQQEIQKISDEIVAGVMTIDEVKQHQIDKGFEFV